MAKKCWRRTGSVPLEILPTEKGFKVIRYEPRQGYLSPQPESAKPFFIVNISGGLKTEVHFQEEVFGTGFISNKVVYLDLSSDLKKWLQGSQKCYEKKHSTL